MDRLFIDRRQNMSCRNCLRQKYCTLRAGDLVEMTALQHSKLSAYMPLVKEVGLIPGDINVI